MSLISRKLAIPTTIAISLAGCGGGSGGDDGESGSPNVSSYVDGEFVYTSTSGKNFQNPDGDMVATACSFSTRYFESENFMVFSGAKHSDDQLKKIATLAERSIKPVVQKSGLSDMTGLYQAKKLLGHLTTRSVVSSLTDVIVTNPDTLESRRLMPDELSDYFVGKMPQGSGSWSSVEVPSQMVDAFVWNTLMSEPDRSVVLNVMLDMAEEIDRITGQQNGIVETIQDNIIHEKIQVCAIDSNSANGTVQGFNTGVNVTTDFYRHELTHFVQRQMTSGLPRWVTEGQAVVFAGQPVASSGSGWNPADVFEQSDEIYPTGEAYKQYGRAYNVLAQTNDISKIQQWFREASYEIVDPQTNVITSGKEVMIEKFGEIMVDGNGDPMSYQDFRAKL